MGRLPFPAWHQGLLILFALTLLVSAFLLFWVQLMVAKMLLPLLGGAPAVWNTCLFFFQALLLLGYGYSDWITRRLTLPHQAGLQGAVFLLPLGLLPLQIDRLGLPPTETNPLPWLLLTLLLGIGLPFFALATLAPLLQAWFSRTTHPQAQDPYFLYGASNLGSLLGLLGYPLVLEPHLTLTLQNQLWAFLYAGLGLLLLGCFSLTQSHRNHQPSTPQPADIPPPLPPSGLDLSPKGRPWRWVILAFIPSSWLLSVTTYITTDMAAIPLFWALPLGLYLLTFIVAFAQPAWRPPNVLMGLMPLLSLLLVMLLLLKVTQPLILVLPLHLLGFTLAAYCLHNHLAQSRPVATQLTRFYLAIAFGGMLGGVFNSLLAPLLFKKVLEYPLMILMNLLLWRTLDSRPGVRLTWPLSLGLLVGCLSIGWQGNFVGQGWALLVCWGLVVALGWLWPLQRWQIGLGLVLMVLLNQFSLSGLGGVLARQRSFFGVYQVLQDAQTNVHSLIHGTTVHGQQNLTPGMEQAPLTYFTPSGPIGQVFQTLDKQLEKIAVLGLGIGTLIQYGHPHQAWWFYEIDPLVVELASNPNYFTYLEHAPVQPEIIFGDGRLQLAQAEDRQLDLLVMDAFSSDAIPVHLLTQEALELYLQKLKPTGMIAINITNRFLDLEPVIAAVAERLNLTGLHQYDRQVTPTEQEAGKTPSRWIILAPNPETLAPFRSDPRWQPLKSNLTIGAWTDDFSQVLPLIQLQPFGSFPNPE